MDKLFTEIETIHHGQAPALTVREEKSKDFVSETKEATPTAESSSDSGSPAQILSLLKSNPRREEISAAIFALDPFNKRSSAISIDIRVPSPVSAQLLNALVTMTIPDHWDSINAINRTGTGDTKLRGALLRCLSSVSGINCLVTQLRSLIAQSRASSRQADASGSGHRIRHILEVVSALLEPIDLVWRLYSDTEMVYGNATQKQVAWKELVSQLATGRLLSISAEAISLAGASDLPNKISWVGTGPQYASWLGSNISHMASKLSVGNEEHWKAVSSLTGRALSLGYTGPLVREIYYNLLVEQTHLEKYTALFDHLRWTEQLTVLDTIFRDIEKRYFSTESFSGNEMDLRGPIDGVAALCSVLISKRAILENQLVDWLSNGQGGSIQTVSLRRAIIVNLAHQKDLIATLLVKSLEQSADKIYIQHAPMRSQEANTQVILLAAGYLHRLNRDEVKSIGRTSVFLNAVSNRLAATSTRARFLGMIIGTAISQLIEEPGKAMKFDLEEMEGDEATWYLSLVNSSDKIGSLDSIRLPESMSKKPGRTAARPEARTSTTRPLGKSNQCTTKIVAIEEIESSDEEGEDEDDDLIPYEKPDEDPADEDDDPTLLQRNKPTAPVYVRDLIIYLRDTENLDRYELALTTAPELIRRKAGFGTELAEHTEELGLVLVGLQEQSKLARFHELRLQSIIALIVSQPLKMARWFAAVFFDGDLSQAQRSAVLTALGLSAREVAGVGADDAKAMGLPALSDTSFPSKRLPANLEAFYASAESPIASITRAIERASLQPIATEAADSASGPNALKVRKFSSRMEVEKRRQQREAHRQKSTVKDLYKVLSEGFFYPLTGRFEIMMMQFTSSTAPSHNPFFVPHLLTLFIQTLTIIISTSGPHTPFLPTLTHQTLTFLLSLHARPLSSEPTILSALLSLFLAVIDLNVEFGTSGEERLVNDYATQVMELREWVGEVFDQTPAVGDENDPRERVRTLAAGVMIKLAEVMERYQGRLMGVNSGFRY
ncbi:telomere length regulation TEL2 family protein [Aspergillus foveolatus]|uniref:telomere length regulation TEL2 family protein n=1 Tax=Aspergillus foveolatus TaxID=210207 RepID=UPI003CCDE194